MTTLVEHAAERAIGFRVVRACSHEPEWATGFAGVHQVLGPFLDQLEALLGPQARPLGQVFGTEGGEPPDRFLVGLVALTQSICCTDAPDIAALQHGGTRRERHCARTGCPIASHLGQRKSGPRDILVPGQGAGVTFGPPLVRSAIYHGASATHRPQVHPALAGAFDSSSAGRQAWHRSSAQLPVLGGGARRAPGGSGHQLL